MAARSSPPRLSSQNSRPPHRVAKAARPELDPGTVMDPKGDQTALKPGSTSGTCHNVCLLCITEWGYSAVVANKGRNKVCLSDYSQHSIENLLAMYEVEVDGKGGMITQQFLDKLPEIPKAWTDVNKLLLGAFSLGILRSELHFLEVLEKAQQSAPTLKRSQCI